ncbi:MAG: adenylate/guanylate cyclase domain-containing protein [Candidatus Uhrbacteria bacterium]|nr:adenylate/guanylate cyclase domain-containing protein [Candidatus Uhrbacteria bacterium]
MENVENHNDEPLTVSTRNVNLIIEYCKKKGISQDALLSGLGYPESYLTNSDNWIPFSAFKEITKRARILHDNDPHVFYEIGASSTSEGGLGMLEVLKRMLASVFADPTVLIKRVPKYNEYFNKTKDIEILKLEKDHAFFKVKFRGAIDPVHDFHSGPLVKGVIASIPVIWKQPHANVEELVLEYDVTKLLREQFSVFSEIKNDLFYVEGELYGRAVGLVKEKVGSDHHYIGAYRDPHEEDEHRGILITKDYTYKSYPLLRQGQIYNAPYFILRMQWQYTPFFNRVMGRFRTAPSQHQQSYLQEMEDRASYFQRYSQELEEAVRQRNKLITDEKKEIEVLKNQLTSILSSHLPTDLVSRMTIHKLAPKRHSGVVFFADLVGFSKRVHSTEDFGGMMVELNRYCEIANTIIRARNGWVYKYMGDGIMAVFGGYKENEDYPVLARNALEAAQKIGILVNEMGWDIRIGIEYGDFIAGEIGPADDRIWDFLGETINFAARLEQNAGANEVLIGPNAYAFVSDIVNVEEKNITMKGMGEQAVYSFKGFKDNEESGTSSV